MIIAGRKSNKLVGKEKCSKHTYIVLLHLIPRCITLQKMYLSEKQKFD